MLEIPTVVRVLSCCFLMWGELLGNVAGADPLVPGVDARKTGQSQRIAGQDHPNELFVRQQGVHIIQGDVLRVEGDNYFIKELGGKALSIRTDAATMKTEKIQVGDRIEAKVDEHNRALSLLLAP